MKRLMGVVVQAHGNSYGSSGGEAIGGMVILVGLMVIVLLVLAIWATIKAIDLVIRAWRQCEGKSQALRIALVSWFGLLTLLLVCGLGVESNSMPQDLAMTASPIIGVVFAIVTIALLITARSTELKYRQTFLGEPETLVTKVLRRPWWTSASSQAA